MSPLPDPLLLSNFNSYKMVSLLVCVIVNIYKICYEGFGLVRLDTYGGCRFLPKSRFFIVVKDRV